MFILFSYLKNLDIFVILYIFYNLINYYLIWFAKYVNRFVS